MLSALDVNRCSFANTATNNISINKYHYCRFTGKKKSAFAQYVNRLMLTSVDTKKRQS